MVAHSEVPQPVASDSIALWCAAVDTQLSELRRLFEEKIRDDITKGELFDKLYRDLANYRDNFVFANITKRVFTDVIRLFDRVDEMLKGEILERMQRDDLVAHIQSFRNEILQVLRRQDVHIIDNAPASFDEAIQEAVDTKSVPRREDDQKVLAVVHRGFRYHGQPLRPECVVVGRFHVAKEGNDDGKSDRD